MNKKEVAMSDYHMSYKQTFSLWVLTLDTIFSSWLAFRLLSHPFFCHPERKRRIHIFLKSGRLRFTSEKIDSNSSHRFKNLFSKLNLWLFTATKEWRWGWVNGPVF
ncbi:MAG TPA: hypothetical protein VJB34_01210 [Bdellovibrionota bacterium]|nr:hypothetical protein [Bdellovibrionota bacterium]